MDISQDKIDLLERLQPGKAFIVFGEAGTGKTTAGILCGEKLLKDVKRWQKVLYLTYSKLAKRQILDCMQKLKQEMIVEEKVTKQMEVLNYHSLWWELICKYHSFLRIPSKPLLLTPMEVRERALNALTEAEEKEIVPSHYRRKSDGRIDRRRIDDLIAVLLAQVTQLWGNKIFFRYEVGDCCSSVQFTRPKPDVVKTYPLA
jgi:hypothetical protein